MLLKDYDRINAEHAALMESFDTPTSKETATGIIDHQLLFQQQVERDNALFQQRVSHHNMVHQQLSLRYRKWD